MQANKSRDTKPELALRRALFALGFRYRLCIRPVPEIRRTADIVFRKARVAVEVRGCFWHGCPQHYRQPRANRDYWSEKIEKNVKRDQTMDELLTRAGWKIIVVWEHEDMDEAAERISEILIKTDRPNRRP